MKCLVIFLGLLLVSFQFSSSALAKPADEDKEDAQTTIAKEIGRWELELKVRYFQTEKAKLEAAVEKAKAEKEQAEVLQLRAKIEKLKARQELQALQAEMNKGSESKK